LPRRWPSAGLGGAATVKYNRSFREVPAKPENISLMCFLQRRRPVMVASTRELWFPEESSPVLR
jgi:hypothetical protein